MSYGVFPGVRTGIFLRRMFSALVAEHETSWVGNGSSWPGRLDNKGFDDSFGCVGEESGLPG